MSSASPKTTGVDSLVGHDVAHGGEVGVVAAVRRCLENGRHFATVEFHKPAERIADVPVDELTVVRLACR